MKKMPELKPITNFCKTDEIKDMKQIDKCENLLKLAKYFDKQAHYCAWEDSVIERQLADVSFLLHDLADAGVHIDQVAFDEDSE